VLFTDHLYGTINFRGTPYEDLIFELLGCPEVQRLRHMRLMNFDVPYIQDLSSTKRLPHSIGTCYLAYKIVEKSSLQLSVKKKIVAAALIHDIGILPYGHLLESIIKSKNIDFSHEKLVYQILTGTYHVTNIYHQILGSESLHLYKVLKQNNINPADIFDLICPKENDSTAISADIDLDNIDNIHRMAALLGYSNAKPNLNSLMESMFIDKENKLVFKSSNEEALFEWLKMRQSIYTMIIGHPECVPYNAFLSKLLTLAIELNVVNQQEWYVTDSEFENRLMNNKDTGQLASWLLVRPHYELLDYIWLISNSKPQFPLKDLENHIPNEKFCQLKNSSFYFFWTENKLISREVKVKYENGNQNLLGYNSHSILISQIAKTGYGLKAIKASERKIAKWRKEILSYVSKVLPDWEFAVKFPKDYTDSFFTSKIPNEQLKLFK